MGLRSIGLGPPRGQLGEIRLGQRRQGAQRRPGILGQAVEQDVEMAAQRLDLRWGEGVAAIAIGDVYRVGRLDRQRQRVVRGLTVSAAATRRSPPARADWSIG